MYRQWAVVEHTFPITHKRYIDNSTEQFTGKLSGFKVLRDKLARDNQAKLKANKASLAKSRDKFHQSLT